MSGVVTHTKVFFLVENKGSPEDLYVFVDNSNLYIVVFKTICLMEGLGENFKLFVNYERPL
jgi:hypothetical protein